MFKLNQKGQALTEYILLVVVLCFVAMGMTRLYSGVLKRYFEKIAKIRTDYAGQMRGSMP